MSDYLCKNLRLSIRRLQNGQIEIRLADDLKMEEVNLCYGVTEREDGKERRYYLREAMVIAMRRVVQKAIEEGLISDSPGESRNLNIGITPEAGPPQPGLSITFSTDMEF
jgi:hypothetical protein